MHNDSWSNARLRCWHRRILNAYICIYFLQYNPNINIPDTTNTRYKVCNSVGLFYPSKEPDIRGCRNTTWKNYPIYRNTVNPNARRPFDTTRIATSKQLLLTFARFIYCYLTCHFQVKESRLSGYSIIPRVMLWPGCSFILYRTLAIPLTMQ